MDGLTRATHVSLLFVCQEERLEAIDLGGRLLPHLNTAHRPDIPPHPSRSDYFPSLCINQATKNRRCLFSPTETAMPTRAETAMPQRLHQVLMRFRLCCWELTAQRP